ncbi:NAD(P)-binding domain-containing protein [Streptomyces tubbatahanensis]|uniref:NAD(P)-binding domain-containing protein n=1 Tax=Streptomyces tubbatahanensis TaxID=2923272 RepID=A0ABY3XQK0_9ACTN|nr:NAD(P)-binding domain-containing protein [Streptomyces tubbatahanensis]UNS96666.1 NAD(P)-binding domain-containing protein [Streptomyces tubbatahanensis]
MEERTVERIGIIGVGEIGRALVLGLYHGGDESPQVFLSPRGARTAAELSSRYEGVQVCATNQEVVDRSEAVLIAVRRQDRHEALRGLRVDDDKLVVNVMAGVANDDLRRTLGTDAPLVRAIPLPSVRERRSVTVTFPSHPDADALFARLGGVLPVADEAAFNVFSALTGTLTTHYAYLATLTSWATAQGTAPEDADRYVRGLFQGVGRALSDETRSLHQLAADHETPNGNNERIRTTWFDSPNSAALHKALDNLLTDLQ